MAEDESNLLESLPTFNDALKLPAEEYYRFAKGVFDYKDNCRSKFVEMYEKFYDWCKAMNCLNIESKCAIPSYRNMVTDNPISELPSLSTTPQLPTTPMSYIDMINAVGHNGTCYDDYFCTQQSLGSCLHYVFGITCLVFCLGGILSHLLFLPTFNVINNRTGSTLYLTAMSLFDCLYMILFTLIVVIRHIPYEYIQQLEMYSRFSVYLIPHGLPTMQLMELFSVWITVALLVDRFLYLKFGFHSKIIYSRILSLKIIAVMIVLLTLYTVPKFLEFQLIVYPNIGIVKVMYTTVGFSESFQNLLLHWLKVPVEMFLPYLAVAIFSVLNSIKLYDLMFKRKLSEASKERKLKFDNDCLEYNKLNYGQDDKDYIKFPSLGLDSKIPMITNSLKCLENKENDVVIVVLVLGFSLLVLKIPKFILHALKSEKYVETHSTRVFQPVVDFLDLFWVISKPGVFFVAKHFRMALLSVFCCKDINNEVIVEVKPALEMNELAKDYLKQMRNLDEENLTGSQLLETKNEDSKLNEDINIVTTKSSYDETIMV